MLDKSFKTVEELTTALEQALSQIKKCELSGDDWTIQNEVIDTGMYPFSFIAYKKVVAKSEEEALTVLKSVLHSYKEVIGLEDIKLNHKEAVKDDFAPKNGSERYVFGFNCYLEIKADNKDSAVVRLYEILDSEVWWGVDDLTYDETGEVLEYDN
jgi:hypothetical protein